jgi:hypothetical protein
MCVPLSYFTEQAKQIREVFLQCLATGQQELTLGQVSKRKTRRAEKTIAGLQTLTPRI